MGLPSVEEIDCDEASIVGLQHFLDRAEIATERSLNFAEENVLVEGLVNVSLCFLLDEHDASRSGSGRFDGTGRLD